MQNLYQFDGVKLQADLAAEIHSRGISIPDAAKEMHIREKTLRAFLSSGVTMASVQKVCFYCSWMRKNPGIYFKKIKSRWKTIKVK